jgi:hypothetical protein
MVSNYNSSLHFVDSDFRERGVYNTGLGVVGITQLHSMCLAHRWPWVPSTTYRYRDRCSDRDRNTDTDRDIEI